MGRTDTVNKLRILVVDDEAILRLDLSEMLAERGHDIVGEADNGGDAVTMARTLKPDLVIMDVKMPGMSGLEASKIIADEQIAPVLLLTAYSQRDVVEQATDSGVMAYLVKPIREEELTPAIEIAINRWNSYKTLQGELEKAKEDLETRKLLDRAKGILMDQHGFSEHDAFQAMQHLSMDRRLSLKAVAQAVIAAAEVNGRPGRASRRRQRMYRRIRCPARFPADFKGLSRTNRTGQALFEVFSQLPSGLKVLLVQQDFSFYDTAVSGRWPGPSLRPGSGACP